MSYRALLFCPEPKIAEVITQILGDLDFQVEPCHEPVVAVQKLTEAHWDAVLADCADDQNAALLFKQARSSGSNPPTLAVAVVDGKSGIAVAFRLGANLVLTKPISIEQSKSTLRVARRLLGGNGAAKPATTATPPSPLTNPIEHSTKDSAVPASAAPFAGKFPPSPTELPSWSPSASLPELEQEPQPEPATAALYESGAPQTAESTDTVNLAAPAISLHSSAPVAAKTGAEKLLSAQASGGHTSSAAGAAAAPALAKEADAGEIEERAVPAEPPATSVRVAKPKRRKSGNTIPIVVLITLLIAAAAVGYVQWRNMHRAATAAPMVKPVAPAQPAAATQLLPSTGAAVQPSTSPTVSGQASTAPAVPASTPPQSGEATPGAPQSAAKGADSQPAPDKTAPAQATPAPKGKAAGAAANPGQPSPGAKPE